MYNKSKKEKEGIQLETLEEFKNEPTFYISDRMDAGGPVLLYYFQKEPNLDKFYEGGVLVIPLEKKKEVIPFYRIRSKEIEFSPEYFPDWFKEIAQKAVKTYNARTRLRYLFEEREE